MHDPELLALIADRRRLLRQLAPTLADVGGGTHGHGSNMQRQTERRTRRQVQAQTRKGLTLNNEALIARLLQLLPVLLLKVTLVFAYLGIRPSSSL
jgi:hypothetical protein